MTLKSLSVRNFAVIESLELDFGPGLTAFTGETGAGKSILIEALGFLLGQRGSTDWLRSGAERLEVEGVFASGIKTTRLRRELDSSGRSKASVDGKPATLAALAALGESLADFHGQHEQQTLLKPALQLELLDGFGGLEDRRARAAEAHRLWKEARSQLSAMSLSEDERLRRVDLYRHQLKEIEEADPRPGEEEELEAELPRLKNAARLAELAAEAYDGLYEREGSAQETLGKAARALSEMARLDPSLEETVSQLERARSLAAEAAEGLSSYREGERSPERLDAVLTRQDRLAKLRKKYGATLADVLAYRDKARAELSALENRELRTQELEAAAAAAERELEALCGGLHDARVKAAKKLCERAAAELKDLGMPAARLSVSVEMEEGAWGPTGADRVEFLIAANPGEPMKPLRAVASGGELSRVMLALKTVLARQDKVGLLVFDEVDAGIGGSVARAVGEKLAELGAARQVLCVTHLPQVACSASQHFDVAKTAAGGRTATKVERLSGERRVEALALMLGGRKVTDASLRHARELMESK